MCKEGKVPLARMNPKAVQFLKVGNKTKTNVKLLLIEVLKKCKTKSDCLVYEMLFIRALKPNLNVQSDSIRAKVFL